MARVLPFCLFLLLALGRYAIAAPNTWKGGDREAPADWHVAANWSRGAVPASGDQQDVLIPGGLAQYPVLRKAAEVGGSLTITQGAVLTLGGQSLSVAAGVTTDFNTDQDPARLSGLIIEAGGTLDAAAGTPAVTLGRGNFTNNGAVRGSIILRIAECCYPVAITPGKAALAGLQLAYSAYPYPVTLAKSLTVAGNVEIGGGNLIVPQGITLTINGDLRFRGKRPVAAVTPNGDIRVAGALISEGAANCVGTCRSWVTLVGEGKQTIVPGGFLPPIKLDKASGVVTLSDDLTCAGLAVMPENTLDLSNGKALIFGVTSREWRIDGDDKNIVKTYLPDRGSRDLLNEGTIIGTPSVPVTFNVVGPEKRYAVSGWYYLPPREEADPDNLTLQPTEPFAGNLTISAKDSRLQLKDGGLLLDGKPLKTTVVPDVERAGTLERLANEACLEEKAVFLLPSVREIAAQPAPDGGAANIAPYVAELQSQPSIGTGIWKLVDGSPDTGATFRTGIGGGGRCLFRYTQPVTVSAVRFYQGDLFAIRYALYADTTGDGHFDTMLAMGSGGAPRSWSQVTFPATRLYRLGFKALDGQQGWEKAYPDIAEFEIYADPPSATAARAAATWLAAPNMPGEITRFSEGGEVTAARPALPANEQIVKSLEVDIWMVGLGKSTIPTGNLRDHPPVQQLIRDVKALGANSVTLILEAERVVFWPSRNFKSLTNFDYFQKRDDEIAGRMAEAALEKDAMLDDDPDAIRKRIEEEMPPIDPPNTRDLLQEFCAAMHEQGISVYIRYWWGVEQYYIGPPDRDPWVTLFEEITARDVDGIFIYPDEAYFGLATSQGSKLPADDPTRLAFKARWGAESDLPGGFENTLNYRRHVLSNYEAAAALLKRRVDAIKRIKPQCKTLALISSVAYSGNNRMTYGLAYDLIAHQSGIDYLGTDYLPRETRYLAAASPTRTAVMTLYVGNPPAGVVSTALQGTRMLTYYRYNYIKEHKATETIQRGLTMLNTLETMGVFKAQPPRKIALLVSRASEDWWDQTNGTYWLGWNPVAKQGFWTSRLMNDLLLDYGYPFETYYLDQLDTMPALDEYALLILPFPYALSREAAERVQQAAAKGTRVLIAQRRGEVDQYGTPYEQPILQPLIARGQENGNVVFLDRNLVETETGRAFIPEMMQLIDRMLGKDKPLSIERFSHPVECYLRTNARESFVTLIDGGDGADVLLGIPCAPGHYRMTTLSSLDPAHEKAGAIAGQTGVTAETLQRFAVKLDKGEVRCLRIVPVQEN